MRSPDPTQTRRQLQSFIFGCSDMAGVIRTAEYLLETGATEIDLLLRRTIEAGLITVYCRPFIESKGLPKLRPSSSMAEHLKVFHREVLNQRHRVQAHTDETDYRVVLDFDDPDWLERFSATGVKGFAETWSPPTLTQPEYFVDLATANRESFVAAIERLHRRLARTAEDV